MSAPVQHYPISVGDCGKKVFEVASRDNLIVGSMNKQSWDSDTRQHRLEIKAEETAEFAWRHSATKPVKDSL